ncbi:phosphate signaling complex protein PhoU [Paraneptunicella aestuarii]|uniref:phosphate signaling complex protein PhoU n=1 Tax=Paraneptunicella aestuarii TaxID=2831148 RepID=UPI001E31FF08|nr:phosphate signaling complex protein PhoU [Paraneptunicella aestuarii]UAA37982.1 phosphate signaling complex protein PhoU [Paraneptunicella aestuarii]
MKDFSLSSHISGRFNQELESLKNALLSMGGIVEQQLGNTLVALRDDDKRVAEQVVLEDSKVNQMELRIDQECMRIIARRNPTAGDLRLVLTIVKINTDIERIGDEVERIARMVVLKSLPSSEAIKAGMFNTGHLILDMIRGTLDAFARMDVEAAQSIHKDDARIDKEYKKLLILVLQEMQQEAEILPGWLDVLWALRAMERIGDRCKNICEYLIYSVEGINIRHAVNPFNEPSLDDEE